MNVDDLGFGYPTFPQFQAMLRDYEADLVRQYQQAEREADVARDMYNASLALTPKQIAALAWQAGGQYVPLIKPCNPPDVTVCVPPRDYAFNDRRRESLVREQQALANGYRTTPS